jgi:TolB-like protein
MGKRIFLGLVLLPVILAEGFAQEEVLLDRALENAVHYLDTRMDSGAQIALLNFRADTPEASGYMQNQLTALLVNGNFTVVNRQDLDILNQEIVFQGNLNVSDEEMVSIGINLAAKFIVTGSLDREGNSYYLNIRVIDVEKSVNVGAFRERIKLEGNLRSLLRPRREGSSGPDDDWKDNLLFLGAKAAYSHGIYQAGDGLTPYTVNPSISGQGTVEGGITAALNFAYFFHQGIGQYLGLQTEAVYTIDSFKAAWTGGNSQTVTYSSLTVPLFLKFVLRPGIFMIQGYGGLYVSIPLGRAALNTNGNTSSASFSVLGGFAAGGSAGIKLGPGVLFGDFRYGADFTNLKINDNGSRELSRRSKISVSLGYEIGLLRP